MKTWVDCENHAKTLSPASKTNIENVEEITILISSLIAKRNELGMSQRDLAAQCGLPQSSVARIESLKTIPKLDTLLKLMRPLGLKFQLVPITFF